MKKILILGASRYYLRVIEAAKRLGYYAIAVDKNPDAVGFRAANAYAVIDITDSTKVYEYAVACRIDGIAAVNDFGVFTAAWVAEKMGLPGLPIDTARMAINKAALREQWRKTGQPNPRYRIAASFGECVEAIGEIGLPVILKPAVSMGGGRGVVSVEAKEHLESAYGFATAFYPDKTILVEEMLKGLEHSAEVLVHRGKGHLLALCDNIKEPLPYRVNKSLLYPTMVAGGPRRKIEEVVVRSVEALGIENGCAHVECCSLPNGEVVLFEMGARPGGGGIPEPIVPFLTGVNEFEQYVRLCVGDEPDALAPRYEKGCAYHFIIPAPGRIRRISGVDEVRSWKHVLDIDLFLKPGDMAILARTGLERAGFVITGGETREQAYELALKAEKSISFEYEV